MHPKPLKLLFIAILGALTLCQCATNQTPEPRPGQTYINAIPEKKHCAGLKGMRIESVNGEQVGKSATAIRAGSVKTVISVNWPGLGIANVPMKFQAREGHSYYIKYDVYPHVGSGTTKMGEGVISKMFNGLSDPYVAAFAVLTVPVVTAAVLTKEAVGGAAKKEKHMRYMDIMVISRLSSEGVVSHVRAYPKGRVEKR